jgi:hypothetical protein
MQFWESVPQGSVDGAAVDLQFLGNFADGIASIFGVFAMRKFRAEIESFRHAANFECRE